MVLSVRRLLFVATTMCAVWSPFALAQIASPAPATVPGTQTTPPGSTGEASQGTPAQSAMTPPKVLFMKDPSYTEAARSKKINGDVIVALTVDENGLPQDVRVKQSLDPGLDQKAVEAVRQYKFKPAMRDGVPVSTKLFVRVNFKIFNKAD